MRLSQRFIVIEINPRARSEGIANFLEALVEVRSGGKPVLFTYGLAPVQRHQEQERDWRRGITFDTSRGGIAIWRPVVRTPQSAGRFHACIRPGRWIGIGVGRNRHTMDTIDPSHPEVRAWWLSLVGEIIRAGADGVDLRFNTHSENLDWENYSFSGPIVEEFRRRYGVDIIRDPFSRETWRRLRGEYLDLFMKQASELLHRAGKRLQFHLQPVMGFEADGNTYMEMAWNWKEWIQQGFVDGVMLRGPSLGDPLFHVVGVETEAVASPLYLQTITRGWKRMGIVASDYIRRCQEAGMDGVNFYESQSLLRLRANGEFAVLEPSVPEALRA